MRDFDEIMYDETRVPEYTLPELCAPGMNAGEWMRSRRNEIRRLLEKEFYGAIPPRPVSMKFETVAERKDALDGLAIQRQVKMTLGGVNGSRMEVDLLVYIPQHAAAPVPVFTGLNFLGNYAATPEKDIPLGNVWTPLATLENSPDGMPAEGLRSVRSYRWSPKLIAEHGFGLVTACYCQFFPDCADGAGESIYNLFEVAPDYSDVGSHPAISAWAWGLLRLADYVESEPAFDAARIGVLGLSRLGKAALWAGACDTRFALVVSVCSGCCGAALNRRCYGETPWSLRKIFPHWLHTAAGKYDYYTGKMPFDQHFLLSLVAPRALYVISASKDCWADPKGEFLSLVAARDAWKLFGVQAWPQAGDFPPPDTPLGFEQCAYHLRQGVHECMEYDWQQVLVFADRQFGK